MSTDNHMTTDVVMEDAEELEEIDRLKKELALTERKFRRACEQIVYLNCRLAEVQHRYDLRPFQYSYHLQLTIIERVRNLYHEYAEIQAEKIRSLELKIFWEVRADYSDDEYDL